jgi:deoxyribose-phosphate aldolase
MVMHRKELAKMIDQTLLDPSATRTRLERFLEEAKAYEVYAVCVNPTWVPLAVKSLQESGVKVCSTVGFPSGASLPEVKAFEAQTVVSIGADEVDMVINIGALKSQDYDGVVSDIARVVEASHGRMVKVIIETGHLSDPEKAKACELAEQAGAAFVKTSTGFGPGGATVADIRLLREIVGNRLGVKASVGIRTLKTALDMIEAGANRIGTSSGIRILKECPV